MYKLRTPMDSGNRAHVPHGKPVLSPTELPNPWTCYLCGNQLQYRMAGERLIPLGTDPLTLAVICPNCVDEAVRAALAAPASRKEITNNAQSDTVVPSGVLRDSVSPAGAADSTLPMAHIVVNCRLCPAKRLGIDKDEDEYEALCLSPDRQHNRQIAIYICGNRPGDYIETPAWCPENAPKPQPDTAAGVITAAVELSRVDAEIKAMVKRDARQFDLFGKYHEKERAIKAVVAAVVAHTREGGR